MEWDNTIALMAIVIKLVFYLMVVWKEPWMKRYNKIDRLNNYCEQWAVNSILSLKCWLLTHIIIWKCQRRLFQLCFNYHSVSIPTFEKSYKSLTMTFSKALKVLLNSIWNLDCIPMFWIYMCIYGYAAYLHTYMHRSCCMEIFLLTF